MNALSKIALDLVRMLWKKSNTIKYPYVQAEVPQSFRGALKYNAALCTGCKLCERVCPADAIVIEKVADKQFKATVHMDKCIFCGQCVDSCRRKSLENTVDFELATSDKASLKVDI